MFADARTLARETLSSFSRHGGRMLAAAVAFSSLLSVAPVLVIALDVAGIWTGQDAARASVAKDLARWVGEDGASTIMALLARRGGGSGTASVLSALVLVYASTRLFSQMKRALNHMWDVHPKSAEGFKGKALKQLRKRALAFAMVLLVGVVILAVVVIKSAMLAATHDWNDTSAQIAWRAGETALSLLTTTVLFAAIFLVMPDAKLAKRDAWAGALATAVLFAIGTVIISAYLAHKTLGAMYGAAGSIVMLLLWVHYSAQVFFMGAAFTAVLAKRRGREIEPSEHAVRVRVEEMSD